MIDQGIVHSVRIYTLGSTLAANAAISATTLVVDDPYDFNEDGGTLQLNGLQYAYTSANFDTATITLSTGLTVAAVATDRVDVWPLTPEKQALVVVSGAEDALTVRVPHALFPLMQEGIRAEDAQESVTFTDQGGELVITDVVGKGATLSTAGAPLARWELSSDENANKLQAFAGQEGEIPGGLEVVGAAARASTYLRSPSEPTTPGIPQAEVELLVDGGAGVSEVVIRSSGGGSLIDPTDPANSLHWFQGKITTATGAEHVTTTDAASLTNKNLRDGTNAMPYRAGAGSFAISPGSTITVTHGLGATPTWAVATTHGTNTYFASIASFTSTTVVINICHRDSSGTPPVPPAVPSMFVSWIAGITSA